MENMNKIERAIDTLQDLTGQESGIIIYDSGETIVCNWSALDAHELPKLFSGLCLIGWESGEDIFENVTVQHVDDFGNYLASRDDLDLIYDENGDMNNESVRCAADIYTLNDGTVIIAPTMWN